MAKSRSTYPVADLRATVNKALNLEVEGNDPQFRNGLRCPLQRRAITARATRIRFTIDPRGTDGAGDRTEQQATRCARRQD
jgi:hypothetical protein